jgi:prolyl-tRNA synthetase
MEISETKLKKALGAFELRPAHPEEIRELGSVVGFVSPLKLKLRKIGDFSLTTVKNFYTGADEDKKDTLNVNYGRDFTVDLLIDVAVPPSDCRTPEGKPLQEARGIEVGNIFQLGTHYSQKMSRATFMDKDGKAKPYYMGCYGIGVGRTLATVVEVHRDEKGIVWPKAIAPYQIHLIHLGKEAETYKAAEKLYATLEAKGFEVLWDDREAGPGEKFNDADLIGIPVRLVLSQRSLEKGGLEWKERASPETRIVPEKNLFAELKTYWSASA